MHNFLTTIIAAIASLSSCSTGIKPNGNVTCYEYHEQGMMAQPIVEFKVEKIDDKTCLVSYYNHERPPRQDKNGEYILDKSEQPIELLDSISKIVADHKMLKYKKHYKPIFEVLDGESWYLTITLADQSQSSSSGHCAGPKDDGMTIITRMLRERFTGL